MKLPIPQHPTFKETLPVSGIEVKYRPYTTQEERILMIAAASQEPDENDIRRAILQVFENASDLKVENLHPVDVEWLYSKIYQASVSPYIDIDFFPFEPCCEEMPDSIPSKVDLSKITVEGIDAIKEAGFTNRNGKWIIMLDDKIGIQMNEMRENPEATADPIYDCVEAVFSEEEVYTKQDFSEEDFKQFLSEISVVYLEKIKKYFDSQPYTKLDYFAICPKCGHKHEETAKGIGSFFV